MRGRHFAYTPYDWKSALKAMETMARKTLEKAGGAEKQVDGKTVWLIPAQQPQALPLEQWPFGTDAASVPLPEYEY